MAYKYRHGDHCLLPSQSHWLPSFQGPAPSQTLSVYHATGTNITTLIPGLAPFLSNWAFGSLRCDHLLNVHYLATKRKNKLQRGLGKL